MHASPIDTRTIEALLSAGRYDFVNPGVSSKNFGSGPFALGRDPKVFSFQRWMDAGEVVEAMGLESYRPALVADGLLYGINNPYEQLFRPIIALDAIVAIDEIWPASVILTRHEHARVVLLTWRNDSFQAGTGFLGVRK